jgi:hypothetical protein
MCSIKKDTVIKFRMYHIFKKKKIGRKGNLNDNKNYDNNNSKNDHINNDKKNDEKEIT